ncbi:UDP-N-acetylmuramoyl-tripeptide--D-alanyl-D-alanine ligase [uncultured Oceanicoccus sp.]|uniref:UDP-N-acetylmuramoyl-tripeptide--D-alanyl-D- alanine ligase n=1 Tax=uncultured Oceanicoccus sp. TaxID=1706381 RepID=UPI0030D79DE8
MSTLSLSAIAAQTGGEVIEDVTFSRVCTDSRGVQDGDLFVALSGENFNGNLFVNDAANSGAVAAIVSDPVDACIPCLQVEDSRLALGLIAKANRQQFFGPVVGLTGSAGKTSTKEMVASILSEMGKVLATDGNLNNEIGVPQTLLQLEVSHDYAVVEMGAGKKGDIAYLMQFVEPTISILTNAMPVHIEGFGNLEAIAKTKGEIFAGLAEDDTAIINLDDQFYQQWRQQAGAASIISFSKNQPQADFYASDITLLPAGLTSFNLHSPIGDTSISLSVLGEHNVVNALAAAAAAMAAGAGLDEIKSGLENVQPVNGRLKAFYHNDQTIIDDSYNASPGSMKAAIDVLAGFTGERCLIMGTMSELGDMALSGHREVAEYAKAKGIEQLIVVGEYAELVAETFGKGCQSYNVMSELLPLVNSIEATTLLIKGSRSARMERAVQALLTNHGRQQ